ncbi:DUF2804 family protein [Oceanirhabdus seepicola]|uniref:DUF2804 family protein n=1 Tax=Oceanirhabdus seepicola TaxID=2828781 RepID=A0A9J6NZ09_9CLOT|nr:DUF2804 family protein [Oceanirhabdus seepicola]MCM1988384.1 DUF2804 family protein [Oceanirhabdus seepicola]
MKENKTKTLVDENKTRALVDENGTFNFGTYKYPIENVNMLDCLKPFKIRTLRKLNYARLKEWEAFQGGNDRFFILGSIYNVKWMAMNIIIVYDKLNDKVYEYKEKSLERKSQIGKGMMNNVTEFTLKNTNIKFVNKLDCGEVTIHCFARGDKTKPDIDIKITGRHIIDPNVICHPFGMNRGVYSHKEIMRMNGEMIFGDEKIVFNEEDAFMIIDDHKGFYPFKMKYDWVTGYGFGENGNLIGFNLTDNQVIQPQKYNENCLWNHKKYELPNIKFTHVNEKLWNIKDEKGKVNVEFTILNQYELKFNCGVMYSDYEAPFGVFNGTIETEDGIFIMKDFFGMGEKKRLRL